MRHRVRGTRRRRTRGPADPMIACPGADSTWTETTAIRPWGSPPAGGRTWRKESFPVKGIGRGRSYAGRSTLARRRRSIRVPIISGVAIPRVRETRPHDGIPGQAPPGTGTTRCGPRRRPRPLSRAGRPMIARWPPASSPGRWPGWPARRPINTSSHRRRRRCRRMPSRSSRSSRRPPIARTRPWPSASSGACWAWPWAWPAALRGDLRSGLRAGGLGSIVGGVLASPALALIPLYLSNRDPSSTDLMGPLLFHLGFWVPPGWRRGWPCPWAWRCAPSRA